MFPRFLFQLPSQMLPPNPQTDAWKRCLGRVGQRGRLNANTLLAENINHQLRGPVVAVHLGGLLEQLDVFKILVEQVRAVHRATLGFGVELGRENGPGLVKHALVAAIVQVDKVLLEFTGQSASINGITVVLAGDMALTSGQVQSRDVVRSVSVLELDGLRAHRKGQKLMAQANSHDGNRGGLHQARKVVDGLLAVSRVTGAVGNENTVKVVRNLVDGIVIREDRHSGATADEAAKNVLLDTAVDQSNVVLGPRVGDNEGSLCANALDKVDLTGIDETLVLVGIVFVSDGNPGERRALLAEVGNNGTGVNTGDGGNTFTGTPLAQTLNCCPMAVLFGNIGDHNAGALDMRGLEVLQKIELVTLVRGDAVVTDERLGEHENLAAVGGIGHGFGISHEGGSEDGFTGDVGVGTKGGTVEDGAILYGVSPATTTRGAEMRHTLMVRVASVFRATAEALESRAGMDRPLLPVAACLLR